MLAALVLVVVLRYPGTMRWTSAAAWVYLAVAVSILGTAVFTLARARSSLRQPAGIGGSRSSPG